MNLQNEFQPIRNWAASKGILEKGDAKTQTIKLAEEFGELGSAILKQNKPEVKDAIGDMVVVLTSIAYFNGFTIEECINSAYEVIAARSGNMINGNFVKK